MTPSPISPPYGFLLLQTTVPKSWTRLSDRTITDPSATTLQSLKFLATNALAFQSFVSFFQWPHPLCCSLDDRIFELFILKKFNTSKILISNILLSYHCLLSFKLVSQHGQFFCTRTLIQSSSHLLLVSPPDTVSFLPNLNSTI